MDITDIRMRKTENCGRMLAVASVTFFNAIVVHDIKVIDGQNGLFIAMPNRKTPDGEFKDVIHPINQAVRNALQTVVLNTYEAMEG